jgi:hypothetical protein
MEVMKVYNEAMATWIIARVTSGKCEGAEFVFGLIEADRTKGSIISNLEKCAYLTTTRLSSSTSNRYAQPTAASGRWRKSRR